jgi:hypothetical protein
VKRVDDAEMAWLRSALEASRGKFTMVVLGHPLYANGEYQAAPDSDFRTIHQLLRAYDVNIAMAGDTHDLEYYIERVPGPSGERVMHHFVNGGGGAYLSLGTARKHGHQRMGVLSVRRSDCREDRGADPILEASGLVVDPPLQRLARIRRVALGGVRLQRRPILPKLH